MTSKQLNIILGVVVVVLLGVVGYITLRDNSQTETLSQQNTTPNSNAVQDNVNSTQPLNTNTQAQQVTPTPTQNPAPAWKDVVYGQFKNLTTWTVNENLPDWRLVSLDRSQLNKYSKGKIFELSKSFNEAGEPDYSGQKSLEQAVKKVLTDNGWKFVVGPTEGSFYNDYLYVKDNHPLVLQIGTRDAVKGGMYISIQFQY